MKSKDTPEFVLEMLKQIKNLCDQNKFDSIQFSKIYPSYLTFSKILETKGIFSENTGKPTWINIEPNLVMAKSVLKIFLENKKQNCIERAKNKVNLGELIFKNKELESELLYVKTDYKELKELKESQERIKDQQIEGWIQKATKLNAVIIEKIDGLTWYVDTIARLKREIIENNESITNYKKEIQVKNESLKEKEKLIIDSDELITAKNEEVLELNQIILMHLEKIQELKNTNTNLKPSFFRVPLFKKVWLFGIPIYSSETK